MNSSGGKSTISLRMQCWKSHIKRPLNLLKNQVLLLAGTVRPLAGKNRNTQEPMYLQQRTVNNTIPESSYVGIYRAYLLSFPRAIQVSRYVTAYSLCDKADVLGAIVKEAPSTILTAKTQIGTRHCTV